MMVRNLSRRAWLAATLTGLALSIGLVLPAQAYDPESRSTVNTDAEGVALHGYDPVSCFAGKSPGKGSPKYTAQHEGAVYRFASAANKAAFEQNPLQYTPQFGGYCAMGVALNHKLDVDPTLWRILDGKLYLNAHKAAQSRWLEDVPANIAQAQVNWPNIRERAESEL